MNKYSGKGEGNETQGTVLLSGVCVAVLCVFGFSGCPLLVFQQVWLPNHPPHLVYSGSTPEPHYLAIRYPIRPWSSRAQVAR